MSMEIKKTKKLYIPIFLSLLVFTTACLPSRSNAADENVIRLKKFLKKNGKKVADKALSNIPDLIYNSVFDLISGQTKYKIPEANIEIGVKVKRKVFDNEDVLNTYSVVDTFEVPVKIPINLFKDVPIGVYGASAGLSMEMKGGIAVQNIRQVIAKDYKYEETSRERARDVETYVDQLKDREEEHLGGIIGFVDSIDDSIFNLITGKTDSSKTKAKFSKISNMLTHPLRLPLKSSIADTMPIGEISSYEFKGYVELAGNIGWNIPKARYAASANLLLKTYLNGRYKISVLKDAPQSATIKLRRVKEKGVGLSASFSALNPKNIPFSGYVLTATDALGVNTSLVPFSIDLKREWIKDFDISYKYDLTNPNARKAYNKAMFGLFSDSEKLVIEKNGVALVKSRKEKSTLDQSKSSSKFLFIYMKKETAIKKVGKIIIETPEERKYFFTANRENIQDEKLAFVNKENSSYKYNVLLDEKIYRSTYDKGLSLEIDVKLKDSYTTYSELTKKIEEVEFATEQYGVFSRFPSLTPEEMDSVKMRLKKRVENLGSSYFHYRISLNREQIGKLVTVSDDELWNILEKELNIKGDLNSRSDRAKRVLENLSSTVTNIQDNLIGMYDKDGGKVFQAMKFMKEWKKVKEFYYYSTNERVNLDFVHGITKLFSTTHFNKELVKIIKSILKNETIEFYLYGKGPGINGEIEKGGALKIDQTKKLKDLEYRYVGVDASIKDLKVKAKAIDKDSVEVIINTKKAPKYFHVSIGRTSKWKRYKQLESIVMKNNDIIKEGETRLLITRGNCKEVGFISNIARAIFYEYKEDYKTIRVGISHDSTSWGKTKESKFILPE